ncbi:restriction endonuclease [Bradyrhizobium sp. ARR65]|uniref:restriction endonuclease n=1 Tax=Bradyrhizobium sp. ARR65 TaxID=1040989 RepID=UPI000A0489D2|nr:restriction endonuclease [Bradyrhizobium sp. ARR65]
MPYGFGNLSPADFEDLVRELVGRELGVRFEGFAAGPDGGMDGRHAKGGARIILQAKHYAGSAHAALKSEIKRERSSIDRLVPPKPSLQEQSGRIAEPSGFRPIAFQLWQGALPRLRPIFFTSRYGSRRLASTGIRYNRRAFQTRSA